MLLFVVLASIDRSIIITITSREHNATQHRSGAVAKRAVGKMSRIQWRLSRNVAFEFVADSPR
jgi:hypothetical protein